MAQILPGVRSRMNPSMEEALLEESKSRYVDGFYSLEQFEERVEKILMGINPYLGNPSPMNFVTIQTGCFSIH